MHSPGILESSHRFFVTTESPAAVYDFQCATTRLHPRTYVRRLRGSRCRTERSFFDEAAAALQLPWYFGHNWNALDECLADVCRDAEQAIVLFEEADLLLADTPAAFGTLVAILDRLATSQILTFKAVFQSPSGDFAHRLSALGVSPVAAG